MPNTISLSDYELAKEEVKKVILSNGIVIYPTDTLYGIGCNALSQNAVQKVYSIKKREAGKPLSVIMADLQMIEKYCTLAKTKANPPFPSSRPYTFILPLRKPLPSFF